MREAKRAHRDEELAFHMQQKQLQLAHAQAAQVHASHAHGQLSTPHLIQGEPHTALLVSGATPPSCTAGVIFLYVSNDVFWPWDCPSATCKCNWPCLFRSPFMHSIQLVVML